MKFSYLPLLTIVSASKETIHKQNAGPTPLLFPNIEVATLILIVSTAHRFQQRFFDVTYSTKQFPFPTCALIELIALYKHVDLLMKDLQRRNIVLYSVHVYGLEKLFRRLNSCVLNEWHRIGLLNVYQWFN